MEFLILRGHNRLIPQGGLAEFPDAILNAKRLDLYNLYREVTCFIGAGFICLVRDDCYVNYVASLFYDFYVQASFSLLCCIIILRLSCVQVVSRGGFHVGNGINWKGQVFSKMRNHTMANRMTVCSLLIFMSFIFPFYSS